MGHSIAAKYAARPVARFVRPSSRARERHLGLAAVVSFSPASAHLTELRRPVQATVASLHAGWRGPTPTVLVARDGRPRPAVRMRWSRSGPSGSGRRSNAVTAPWRA
ncbi:MAG: hypothetical protein ABIQ58_05460 [Candidatus Limnocylindrales bacterium]